jgi:CMP-N-acetylneuraminic acid synthetase
LEFQIVIPARGGSKRFPGKNTYPLGGIPLIGHSILYSLNFFPKEKIWVNTDDSDIAAIAAGYDVNITLRPDELGSDNATSADVLHFQMQEFINNNVPCDAIILLQVTNPLRPLALLETGIQLFQLHGRESLATFSILNKKTGKIISNNFVPGNYQPGQRMQDKDDEFFENGLLYITKCTSILKKIIITQDVYPMVIDAAECLVDIDEPEDILFAEFLLTR